MIVYFGYTYCPDVCPTDLMAIAQALDALGPAAEGVQPVFITIDPERDTKLLAEYVAAFHRSLVGLTGAPDEIRKVANSYKAFYVKVQDERSPDYSIDHAGVIYLMGRTGEYLGFMPPQTSPDRLTEVLRKILLTNRCLIGALEGTRKKRRSHRKRLFAFSGRDLSGNPADESQRIVHFEFDRMRGHFVARDFGHLQLDIAVDEVVVEHRRS
jgi:protein SCO1/2